MPDTGSSRTPTRQPDEEGSPPLVSTPAPALAAAVPRPHAADGPDHAAAFRALYVAHRDAIWRYAVRRGADAAAAEDVVSEVFTVAWRRWTDVPAPALPWPYGVARRVLANERRAAGRRAALDDRLAAAVAPGGGDPAAAVAERDALLAALALLSPADREVLMLAVWEDLDSDAIATVLGCRPGTARVRLHRARTRLARVAATQLIQEDDR